MRQDSREEGWRKVKRELEGREEERTDNIEMISLIYFRD